VQRVPSEGGFRERDVVHRATSTVSVKSRPASRPKRLGSVNVPLVPYGTERSTGRDSCDVSTPSPRPLFMQMKAMGAFECISRERLVLLPDDVSSIAVQSGGLVLRTEAIV